MRSGLIRSASSVRAAFLLCLGVLALGWSASVSAGSAPLVVDGGPLTIEHIVEVAREGRAVTLDSKAQGRVAAGFEVLMQAARLGMPVYGLTTGVGWNKDHKALRSGALDPELLAASRRFNIGTLRAHGAGVGPWLPDEVVRAAMLVRLNLMLSGAAGVQPALPVQYAAFLNAGITPRVPARGSIGEADILQSSHIGLAMAGEWRVGLRGREMSATEALALTGLQPVVLVGKDFLSIFGDNSLTTARAALIAHDARHWLRREIVVFALSLEGLNGNVAPFLESSVVARPRAGLVTVAERLREALAGSALWQIDAARALQDPLSFRTMPHVLGNAWQALQDAETEIVFETAHSADNPQVVLDASLLGKHSGNQVERYRVQGTGGAIVPSANFESLPMVASLERLAVALAHVSNSIASTIYRYENPAITGLPRFLTAPDNPGHGFGAIQKSVAALAAEIRSLALPVSLDESTLAGNIEDKTSNGPLVVQRLQQLVEALYPLASLQLLHAAQAVDLRPGFVLGNQTQALRRSYRAKVPFVQQDRVLTDDIEAGAALLREGWRE